MSKPDPDNAESLVDRASRAVVFVAAQSLFAKVASLASQLVLANFLLREDFGMYALAMTAYSLTLTLHQGGVQDILIRRQKSFRVWANPAFWFSLATATTACLLTVAAAPWVARFYQSARPDELSRLIMVLACIFPISAAGIVCRAKLQIQMRFGIVVMLGMAHALFDAILKIVLAQQGFGAFSFGYATLASSVLLLVLSWSFSPVRIRFNPQLRRWKYLVGDSAMILSTLFVVWLMDQGDYIVLGRWEPEAVVGVYFFAYKISRHTMLLLTTQISRVLFPALGQIPEASGQRERAFARAARLVAVIAFHGCVLMAVIADPLVRALFPAKWYGAISLIQIMCVGMSLRTLSGPAASLLQSQGRFRTRMILSVISLMVFFPMAIAGTRWGSSTGLAIAVAIFSTLLAIAELATATWRSGHAWRLILSIITVPVLANVICVLPAVGVVYRIIPQCGLNPPALPIAQITAGLITASTIYLIIIRNAAPAVWRDGCERVARLVPRTRRPAVEGSDPVA